MAKYRLRRQKVFALSFNPIKNFGTAFNSTAGTGARIGAGLAGAAQLGVAGLAAGALYQGANAMNGTLGDNSIK